MLVRCQPCQRIFASMEAMRAHQKVGQCYIGYNIWSYLKFRNIFPILNHFFAYFRARNVSTTFLQENLPETLQNKMLMDQRN